ncbi:MAG: aromatic amino acid transport family protein [Candidatus Parvarchaeum sp.]
MNIRYLAALSTTVGTIVGGGILALPYAIEKSGFLEGIAMLLLIGFASILITMYTGELSSHFKKLHQLPVIISKYTGKRLRILILIFQILTIYGAQIAYLTGIALVMVFLFHLPYAVSILLVFLLTLPLIYKGYKLVEDAETPMLFIKVALIAAAALSVITLVKDANFYAYNITSLFGPFGIILFSFTGYTVIPEVKEELGGTKKLTSVIVLSYLISILLYVFFVFSFVGAFGHSVSIVATDGIHSIYYEILFSLTTLFLLLTPYIALSLVLADSFTYDFGIGRKPSLFLSLAAPFAIAFFDFNFESILDVTGGIFISILAIMILFAVIIERKRKEKKQIKYLVPGGMYLIVFTFIVMLLGLAYTIYSII